MKKLYEKKDKEKKKEKEKEKLLEDAKEEIIAK